MRGVLWSLFLLAGLGVGRGAGAGLELPAEWLRAGPGAKEAGLIEEGAVRHGWPAMASALRAGALRAYERGNLAAAEAWAGAAGWAEIWATTEREEGERRRRVEEGEAAPGRVRRPARARGRSRSPSVCPRRCAVSCWRISV